MNLETLSERKLQDAYTKASDAVFALTRALIEAGRGNEKCKDTLRMTDPLSLKFAAATERFQNIVAEQKARQRWHGSLKPIRRPK